MRPAHDLPSMPAEPQPRPAPGLRSTLRTAALVGAGAALPMLAVLLAGYTLAFRDTVQLFEPLRVQVVAALRDGRLPLWNPYEALGMPLFAQPQHGVLHPVSLAFALLAPSGGVNGMLVAHVLLAAVGAFALARELRASQGAAAVAGFGFGLSGYVLSMSCNLPYLAAAGAAPWALVALRRAGRGARFGTVGAALATGVLLLAGDPQWAAVTAALGLALAAEAGAFPGLARAGAGIALGAGLAAIQLLPTWAMVQESSRTTAGLTAAERAQWAFAPWRTLELVAPGFFGGRPGPGVADVFVKLGGPTSYGTPFVPSVFLGAAVVALAVLGLKASRAATVLGVAAAIALWLAFGVNLGADPLLGGLPVWGSFRYAEKLVGPFTLAAAVLAGLGADRLPTLAGRRWTVVAGAGAALVALSLAVIVGGGEGLLASWVGEAAATARTRLVVGLAHLLVSLVIVAVASSGAARARLGRLLPTAAAAIVFVEGVAASPFALHAGERGLRDGDPLRAVRAADVTRIATPTRRGPAPGPERLDALDRAVFLDSRMGVPPYGVAAGIDHVALYSPLWPLRYERVFFAFLRDFEHSRWVAWRRFGVNRMVVDTRLTPQTLEVAQKALVGATKIQPDAGLGFSVWEVGHRPWASFAPAVIPAASEPEAYERLSEAIANDWPAVVLEEAPPVGVASGRVLALERRPASLRIEAEADGEALLVVNDAYWPGWEASIDGRPVPILRADVLVRAVPFPAGRHVLEMRYAPPEVRTGAIVTAAAAAVLLALLAVEVARRRAARLRG